MFRHRWIAIRNRLLADPGFRRLAERFRPTRYLARGHARALFDIVGGFTYSKTLSACLALDLFAKLRDGPLSGAELAAGTGLDAHATSDLLRAGAALKLFQAVGAERFALGPLGAVMLDNAAVAAMVRHHDAFYLDMTEPLGLLRGDGGPTNLQKFWPYATAAGEVAGAAAEPYSALMAASQPMVAEQVLAAYPLARHRRVLDVGGGSGAFLRAVAAAAPGLELALYDLPAVADLAAGALEQQGPAGHIAVHRGDFCRDALPTGADLITLVRIVHDHDDETVCGLLARVHAALPQGGTVLIAEPMADTPGAAAFTAAYFMFYLRAMGSGRPRRPADIGKMLRAAGFVRVQQRTTPVPMIASVMTAEKANVS
ncbi:MAG: methyltransferase [Pseudomonadota bacterium]